ncbi:MAG: bifunctional precorrin-2 dehydrogenase/sirohydrochlorin ferrochelatase [Sulfuricurvum sp.]
MALFPMFVDLEGKDILVIGGGEVALRKIEQLVRFSPRISVVAPYICDEIVRISQAHSVVLERRPYVPDDVSGRFLVIGALDDIVEQEKIFERCTAEKIPVNCVDSPKLCSFIFPALIVEGDLCVGINTSGRAPAVSSALRQYLSALIPSTIKTLIDEVDAIRHAEPAGKVRQEKIIGICRNFFAALKQ